MADQVTQLQQEINGLCSQFCNAIGVLQRDAPPASVGGEEVAATGYDVAEETSRSAVLLASCSQRIHELVKQLPDAVEGEEQQLSRIRQLQEQDKQLGGQLAERLVASEAKLQQLQDLFRVLAEHRFRLQGRGASGDLKG